MFYYKNINIYQTLYHDRIIKTLHKGKRDAYFLQETRMSLYISDTNTYLDRDRSETSVISPQVSLDPQNFLCNITRSTFFGKYLWEKNPVLLSNSVLLSTCLLLLKKESVSVRWGISSNRYKTNHVSAS